MAATAHTPDNPSSLASGHAVTWFTPTATEGDDFTNTTGTVFLVVVNDSADTDTVVTIDCPVACSRGYYHDVTATVPHGTSWVSTILPVAMFADPATGKTLVICSAVTDVNMAMIDTTFTPAA
jgi:hypothetical protein